MKKWGVWIYIADLHQIIKSGQTLTNEHVQYFVYQILRGKTHYSPPSPTFIVLIIIRY